MINFETRFDEALGLWQYRAPNRSWSKPMKLGAMLKALGDTVKETPAPVNSVRFQEQWSKPLVHRAKAREPEPDNLYEIHKGKVRRIPSSRREAEKQNYEELLKFIEEDEG